jgi:hypothetical protein
MTPRSCQMRATVPKRACIIAQGCVRHDMRKSIQGDAKRRGITISTWLREACAHMLREHPAQGPEPLRDVRGRIIGTHARRRKCQVRN